MENKKEYEFCFKAYSWALRHKRLLARRKVGVLEWGEPAKDQQGVWHCLPDPWQASPDSSQLCPRAEKRASCGAHNKGMHES